MLSIWVSEDGLTKEDGSRLPDTRIGLGNGDKLVRGSFSNDFRKHLTRLDGGSIIWKGFATLWLIVLAYIPPYVVSPEKEDAYERLNPPHDRIAYPRNMSAFLPSKRR